jgi:hypothetical protein
LEELAAVFGDKVVEVTEYDLAGERTVFEEKTKTGFNDAA